jgi:hypothetical protein
VDGHRRTALLPRLQLNKMFRVILYAPVSTNDQQIGRSPRTSEVGDAAKSSEHLLESALPSRSVSPWLNYFPFSRVRRSSSGRTSSWPRRCLAEEGAWPFVGD